MRPKTTARRLSANLPTISALIMILAVAPANSALATTDYLHTSGNQIVNSVNQPIRIAGINWYGFETTDYVVHGLWTKDYKAILNTIHSLGYNVVRIPFSNEMVESNPVPTNISYYNGGPINTDLQGLHSLQILDKIIAYAGQIGLRIILDNHRSEAGNSAEDNGLWYTAAYPETAWINDWVSLAKRYNGNSTVIGFDLRNEPHNGNGGAATWGTGDPASDWRLAAQMAGNQVLAVNPHLLIFVEGIQAYGNDWYWWGGNLEGAGPYPVALNVANQLAYSAHDYGPNLSGQPWFNSSTSYSSLASVWTKYWAYLAINKIAPVWVGEFGTDNAASDLQSSVAGSQGQWFQSMIQFLHGNPVINWTYWALNGEDSYALLDSGYDPTPPSTLKQQMLASIQAAGTPGPTPTPTATVKPTPTATVRATPTPTATRTATPTPTPDFSLSVTPPSVSVYAGSAASYTVAAAARNGFAGTISLSVSGLPAGAGASFSPASIAASGSSALKVSTGASTPAGVNTLTVKGVAGTVIHTAQMGLTVTHSGGAAACTVEYDVTSDWGVGMVANVYITNLTGVAVTGWTLSWSFGGNQQIVNLWDGTVAQSGKAVTVRNETWNGSVANGATVMFGFQAAYTGTNTVPNQFVFNGVACSMN